PYGSLAVDGDGSRAAPTAPASTPLVSFPHALAPAASAATAARAMATLVLLERVRISASVIAEFRLGPDFSCPSHGAGARRVHPFRKNHSRPNVRPMDEILFDIELFA